MNMNPPNIEKNNYNKQNNRTNTNYKTCPNQHYNFNMKYYSKLKCKTVRMDDNLNYKSLLVYSDDVKKEENFNKTETEQDKNLEECNNDLFNQGI